MRSDSRSSRMRAGPRQPSKQLSKSSTATSVSSPLCATRRTGSLSAPASQRCVSSRCSRLHLELTHRWDAGADKLPVRRVAQSGLDTDVAVLDFDNCFDGWRGPARIRDERLSLRMTSSLDHVVIY